MFVGRLLRHEQAENEVDRLVIGGFEIDALGQSNEGADAIVDALEAGVGDGHAIPHAGTAELLTTDQAVEHVGRRQIRRALGQNVGQLFERTFLGLHVRGQLYPVRARRYRRYS